MMTIQHTSGFAIEIEYFFILYKRDLRTHIGGQWKDSEI